MFPVALPSLCPRCPYPEQRGLDKVKRTTRVLFPPQLCKDKYRLMWKISLMAQQLTLCAEYEFKMK